MATALFITTTASRCVQGRTGKNYKEMMSEVNHYLLSRSMQKEPSGPGRIIGYNIEACLPDHYVKDASADYTSYIQDALGKYDSVIFPSFPLLVNSEGLSLHSGQQIFFEEGSQLIMKPNDRDDYDVIRIKDCHDVFLYHPSIRGDRNLHSGKTGEWGMGIGIYGSKNVTVFNPVVSDTWGDGIYIGGSGQSGPSTGVDIKDAVITNARRNGISITSGRNIRLLHPRISFTNGTLPMDGIDVEPNSPSDEISGIEIADAITKQNKGYGIEFSLSKLYGGSPKKVDAIAERHTDSGSKSAAYVSCAAENPSWSGKISGVIVFKDPTWKNFGEYVWRPYGLQEKQMTLALMGAKLYDHQNQLLDSGSTKSILDKEVFSGSSVLISE